ncbi:Uncharacterised protein [Providencia rustigianii]|nr:Uncharacterised protein [Providencia rustigianii]
MRASPLTANYRKLNASKAQYDFQQTLGLLNHREQTSVPFWLHFGLNSNQPLLAHLWPLYQQTVLPPLRDNIRQQLEQQLQTYASFPLTVMTVVKPPKGRIKA